MSININAAIDDWLSANKESKMIMKKYADRSRVFTFSLLCSLSVCTFLYIAVVVFLNAKQVFFTDENLMDGKM